MNFPPRPIDSSGLKYKKYQFKSLEQRLKTVHLPSPTVATDFDEPLAVCSLHPSMRVSSSDSVLLFLGQCITLPRAPSATTAAESRSRLYKICRSSLETIRVHAVVGPELAAHNGTLARDHGNLKLSER